MVDKLAVVVPGGVEVGQPEHGRLGAERREEGVGERERGGGGAVGRCGGRGGGGGRIMQLVNSHEFVTFWRFCAC